MEFPPKVHTEHYTYECCGVKGLVFGFWIFERGVSSSWIMRLIGLIQLIPILTVASP